MNARYLLVEQMQSDDEAAEDAIAHARAEANSPCG